MFMQSENLSFDMDMEKQGKRKICGWYFHEWIDSRGTVGRTSMTRDFFNHRDRPS